MCDLSWFNLKSNIHKTLGNMTVKLFNFCMGWMCVFFFAPIHNIFSSQFKYICIAKAKFYRSKPIFVKFWITIFALSLSRTHFHSSKKFLLINVNACVCVFLLLRSSFQAFSTLMIDWIHSWNFHRFFFNLFFFICKLLTVWYDYCPSHAVCVECLVFYIY